MDWSTENSGDKDTNKSLKEEAEANACLIAAAPELLDALKQALNYIKGDYIDADGIEDRLGNVIKKAEGK